MVDLAEVQELFQDPRHELEQVIFVDARSRRYYEEGHVPGAFHLDHFYPDQTLAEVLPAALAAEWWWFTATGAIARTVSLSRSFCGRRVCRATDCGFTGGMSEWREQGLPVELGNRHSQMMEVP
jgi:rhodanese-related sulfurtransferase